MSKIWAYWGEWFPETIQKGTQPIALDRGVLYILVKNSSWMYELNFNRDLILKKVQAQMGEAVVQSIKFTLDPKTLPQDVLQKAEFREFLKKSHFKSQEGDQNA
jgi:predicted nucleic acid-binding Zn ribbon protein